MTTIILCLYIAAASAFVLLPNKNSVNINPPPTHKRPLPPPNPPRKKQ